MFFEFSNENKKKIKEILRKYPEDQRQSAVMPLLTLAQSQQQGWLSQAAVQHIAEILKMPIIRVQEVATFYSMYRLEPVGKTVIQVCTTTPCWLRGSDDVLKVCQHKLGLQPGETKNDISLFEVECLGACVNAPVMQVNETYLEDLDADRLDIILDDITAGQPIPEGSVIGRISSEPAVHLYEKANEASIIQLSKSHSLKKRELDE